MPLDEQQKYLQQHYLDFIASLPYILTTEDYVFAHAGLNFTTNDPIKDTPQHLMLWARDYQIDPAKLGGRTLVTGHSVTALFDISKSLATQHINLDNGSYDDGAISCGALVVLNLDTRELLVQKNIE